MRGRFPGQSAKECEKHRDRAHSLQLQNRTAVKEKSHRKEEGIDAIRVTVVGLQYVRSLLDAAINLNRTVKYKVAHPRYFCATLSISLGNDWS